MDEFTLTSLNIVELSDNELEETNGGFAITILAIAIIAGCAVWQYYYG